MSKKLLALLLAMIMVIGSFTSVLAEEAKQPAAKDETKATEVKPEEKKEEAKPEEKKDEAKPEEVKTEEKKEEKKEDAALTRAMNVLKKAGYISGFSKDSEDFKPEQNVTRAEFASMIVRVMGTEKSAEMLKTAPTGFTDVPVGHWANGYIAMAKNAGYVNGYPDGTFKPAGQITYAEMATMLTIALGKNEAGDRFPQSYIMKAQQLGLFKDVEGVNFSDMATRGDVFKMVYNMVTSKEFGKRKILKAVVLENSRVENLADDEVTVEVIDIVQKADWVTESRDKSGDQHTYKLDKDLKLDAEDLLGKVVDITVDQNDKIVEVKVDNTYDYVEGAINAVGLKKLTVNDKTYSAAFDERYKERDERIFRTYLNNKDFTYKNFVEGYKAKAYDFARVTVKNGKVIFVDAYQFNDVAPVAEVKDGDVYYLDDAWDANVVKAKDLANRVIFRDKIGYTVAERKAIAKDDVIHFYNDYKNAIVRKDAKFEGKIAKTYENRDGEFVVVENNDYYLNDTVPFKAIYSFEGKKFFVLRNRHDLKDFINDKVKVLVALDGSAQLIEGAKPWNDGIQAIRRITSYGDINFLPSKGDAFWAKETRSTYYYDAMNANNRTLYREFNNNDIVYLSRGEKEDEIASMGLIVAKEGKDGYKLGMEGRFAEINGRHIRVNTTLYRYFDGLHAYYLDMDGNLQQVKDLARFIADNKGNNKLRAYVMDENSLRKNLKDYVDTYRFLSESDRVASIVVFDGAIAKYDAKVVYGEVIERFTSSNGLVVRDASGREYSVKMVKSDNALDYSSIDLGDIVKLHILSETFDTKDMKGYADKKFVFKYDKASTTIEAGDYRNSFKLGDRLGNTNYDSSMKVFNDRTSKTVQYALDDDGYIVVLRYVKDGSNTGARNILDVDSTLGNIVIKAANGELVGQFYGDPYTEFFDTKGVFIGRGEYGWTAFYNLYKENKVQVVAVGYRAVKVYGVQSKFEKQVAEIEAAKAAVEAIKLDAFAKDTDDNAVKAAFKAKANEAVKDMNVKAIEDADITVANGVITTKLTHKTNSDLERTAVNRYKVNDEDEQKKADKKKTDAEKAAILTFAQSEGYLKGHTFEVKTDAATEYPTANVEAGVTKAEGYAYADIKDQFELMVAKYAAKNNLTKTEVEAGTKLDANVHIVKEGDAKKYVIDSYTLSFNWKDDKDGDNKYSVTVYVKDVRK